MADHVFISYARADGTDFAQKLHDQLEADGFSAWLDRRDIQPGKNWDDEIDAGLRNCWALLFLMTPKSLESEVCHDEWTRALSFKKPVLPLRLAAFPDTDIPFRLARRQYLDFTGDFDQAMARLRQRLNFMRSPAGEIEELQNRQAELQRELQRADDQQTPRIQKQLDELAEQIAYKQRALTDPDAVRAENQRAIRVDIEAQQERAARAGERERALTRQRVVGNLPQAVSEIFKDRVKEAAAIVDALLADPTCRVVSIYGKGGVGKTALACKVLEDLRKDYDRVHGLVYLSTRTGLGISLEQLYLGSAKMLGGEAEKMLDAAWKNPALDIRARVQTLLTAYGDQRCLLLLDNFEDLQAEDGSIKDDDLRALVETALQQPHGLRLLVTSRERLQFPPGLQRCEKLIPLDEGLPEQEAVALLREFDPNGDIGLKDADAPTLAAIVGRTHGYPRALEAVAGILANDPLLSPQKLLADTTRFAEGVTEYWVKQAQARLDDDARRVMAALAVFGRPVSEAAVRYLLEPFAPGLDVHAVLNRLIRGRFVIANRATGELAIHPLDKAYNYGQIPAHETLADSVGTRLASSVNPTTDDGMAGDRGSFTRRALERRAGDYYRQIRAPKSTWKTIADLEPQLAEFDHRVQAGDYDAAARLLDEIDFDYLSLWGYARHVLPMREELVGKIEDKWLNSNNLFNLEKHYRNLGQIKKGLECGEQALNLFHELGDKQAEGAILGSLGNAYSFLGQVGRAIEYYEQALVIAREIGDKCSEGNSLGNLGNRYSDLGQVGRAIEYYEQALAIAHEIGDKRGEGNRLSNLGLAYSDLGQVGRAIEYYEQALAIAREIGDRRGEGNRLGNLGNAYSDLGQVGRAIEYYEQGLVIAREIGNKRSEGTQLGNLGLAYSDLGQVGRAIEYYEQGLVIAREIGDKRNENAWLGNLGNAFGDLGEIARAIEYYEQALAIDREIGDKRGEGIDLGNLGNAFGDLGQVARAIKYYEQALVIRREIGDKRGEGIDLGNLGIAYSDLGEYQKAAEYQKQALAIDQEIGARLFECHDLGNLGSIYLAQGHYGLALPCFSDALAIAVDVGNPGQQQDNRRCIAQVYLHQGQLDSALTAIAAALEFDASEFTHRVHALHGIILARLNRVEDARAAFQQAVDVADALLAQTANLYEPKYTRGLALAGLAVCEGLESSVRTRSIVSVQPAWGDEAIAAYRAARANCDAAGVVADALRLLDELAPVDAARVLLPIRVALVGD